MSDAQQTSAQSNEARENPRWRNVRLTAGSLVAILLLALVIASGRHRSLQLCSDQLQPSRSEPSVVCHPLAASDAPVVVGVIVIILLLLPDFAEVAIPGLLSLKRRVESQERRQEQVEERLRLALSQSATAQVMLADPATISAAAHRVAGVGRDAEDDAVQEEPEFDEDGDTGAAVDDLRQPVTSDDTEERDFEEAEQALLQSELIARAERLSQAARAAEALEMRLQASVATLSGLSFDVGASTYALIDWWRRFSDEIRYVQAARNTVAHAKPLRQETLRSALNLARKLEDALPADAVGIDGTYAAERAVRFRVRRWLEAHGVRLERGSISREFDLFGMQDDRPVIVELKLLRSRLGRAQLVGWVAQLQDKASAFKDARVILIVSGPGARPTALEYAKVAPVEIYLEIEPGLFVRPADLIT